MKKLMLLFALITATLTVFAQGTDPVDPLQPIKDAFTSLLTLAPLAVVVTIFITSKVLTSLSSTGKQILSWAVCIAIAFVGMYFDFGIFAETGPVWTAIYGIALGLFSNGVFDIGLIQAILALIGIKLDKSK